MVLGALIVVCGGLMAVWGGFCGGFGWFGGCLGWFGMFWCGLGCFNGPHFEVGCSTY